MAQRRRNHILLWATLLLVTVLWPTPPIGAAFERVGTVSVLEGSATINGRPAQVGSPIHRHDKIKTARDGKMRIVFIDQSIISIASGSRLNITEYVFKPAQKERRGRLRVLFGKIKCFVNNVGGYRNKQFEVTTNTAVIGVRGTTFLVWVVDQKTDRVASFQNDIDVKSVCNPKYTVAVAPNLMTEVTECQPPVLPFVITSRMLAEMHEGFLAMDRRIVSTRSDDVDASQTEDITEAPAVKYDLPTTTTTTSTSTSTTTSTTQKPILPLPPFPEPPKQ